jgi:hypothetical protein
VIDTRLLASLNVGYNDQEVIEVIDFLSTGIESGHFRVVNDGDLIVAMKLTALGIESLSPRLPSASA